MGIIQSRIFMVRQIIQHLGWIGVSEEKIRQLAFRFNADQLNTILRRAEIKRLRA
jgi:hypothetical protein